MSQHLVELMVRTTCGSCARVREQITPVVEQAGAELAVRNVDEDAELAVGDALDKFMAFYHPTELPFLVELL